MRRLTSLVCDVSDGGAGIRAMRCSLDRLCDGARTPEALYAEARQKVRSIDRKLVKVFDLIVKNGSNRGESIKRLMCRGRVAYIAAKKRYFRARRKLMSIFNVEMEVL